MSSLPPPPPPPPPPPAASPSAEPPPVDPPKKGGGVKVAVIAISVVIVLGAISGLLWFLLSGSDDTSEAADDDTSATEDAAVDHLTDITDLDTWGEWHRVADDTVTSFGYVGTFETVERPDNAGHVFRIVDGTLGEYTRIPAWELIEELPGENMSVHLVYRADTGGVTAFVGQRHGEGERPDSSSWWAAEIDLFTGAADEFVDITPERVNELEQPVDLEVRSFGSQYVGLEPRFGFHRGEGRGLIISLDDYGTVLDSDDDQRVSLGGADLAFVEGVDEENCRWLNGVALSSDDVTFVFETLEVIEDPIRLTYCAELSTTGTGVGPSAHVAITMVSRAFGTSGDVIQHGVWHGGTHTEVDLGRVNRFETSRDGAYLLAYERGPGNLIIFDTATGALLREWSPDDLSVVRTHNFVNIVDGVVYFDYEASSPLVAIDLTSGDEIEVDSTHRSPWFDAGGLRFYRDHIEVLD